MTAVAAESSRVLESMEEPLVDRLAMWARTRPTAPAYTFVDYLAHPDGVPRTHTWGQVHRRAVALAARLREVGGPGDRVAVLAPSGLEYVVALFAAWHARMIAVPLFAPGASGHADRLATSYEDCAPRCVVTTSATSTQVRDFVAARRRPAPVLVADDGPAPNVGAALPGIGAQPPPARWDDVAYLQYSSGSTGVPAGVEITHRNLTANVRQLCTTLTAGLPGFTGVNWLPLFHDMGLLATVAAPLWAGTDAVLLDPAAFLMRPVRWLRLLSGRPAAYTAAPNFAYDYCARRLTDDDLDGLDLSGVFVWLNGAEPVRAETMRRFTARLREAGTGMAERAMCPAYGLAEATVFVAADRTDRPPRTARFTTAGLAAGRAVPAPPDADADATTLVSCGRPADQHVLIVDPERRTAVPAGHVGEIWVHGPNVARRYWGQPERSHLVLQATLAGPPPDALPAGPWLRTGDLGLLHDGDLFVTGRLKDLLIVAGRNHYPQDIEQTVAETVGAVGRVAAVAVPVDGQDRVVVVAELSRPPGREGPAGLTRLVRQAVWQRHDLGVHDVVLTRTGAIPRTTSGKLSRAACRERYLAGRLARVGATP